MAAGIARRHHKSEMLPTRVPMPVVVAVEAKRSLVVRVSVVPARVPLAIAAKKE